LVLLQVAYNLTSRATGGIRHYAYYTVALLRISPYATMLTGRFSLENPRAAGLPDDLYVKS